jgi:hypothetical protein
VRIFSAHAGTLQCLLIGIAAVTTLTASTGCGAPALASQPQQIAAPVKVSAAAPSIASAANSTTSILLFTGKGTSSGDVAAVEAILSTLKLNYATADSTKLDNTTETELKAYKLFIVPGGNSITIGENLSSNATTAVRNAVTKDGMHYLGICAGAFFGGYSIHNGLDLTSGVWFDFYEDELDGIHKEAVEITAPNKTQLDIYWQDGPQLSGWGSVVSKYPDGTSAIVEGKSGNGWVILSGVHPEAPASWRTGMKFNTPLATDLAYAGTLVVAALNGTSLPHY